MRRIPVVNLRFDPFHDSLKREGGHKPEWHLVKAYISVPKRLTRQQRVLGFRHFPPRVAAGQVENTRLFSGLEVAAAETQHGPKNRWKTRAFVGP